jgi:hypothetical protein
MLRIGLLLFTPHLDGAIAHLGKGILIISKFSNNEAIANVV